MSETVTAYCSVQDVRDLMDTLTPDVVPDRKILRMIRRAMAEIDSYIKKKCTLPLVTIPDDINEIAANLALSKVLGPAHSGDGTSEEVPYSTRIRNEAIARLVQMRDGEVMISGVVKKPSIYMSNFNVDGTLPPMAQFDLYSFVDNSPTAGFDAYTQEFI
jgi:Protein of unknown function (DUF1320).